MGRQQLETMKVSNDIVARLRRAHPQSEDGTLRHEAADEIERSRFYARSVAFKTGFPVEQHPMTEVADEIERLRQHVADLRHALREVVNERSLSTVRQAEFMLFVTEK
jgi:polyhydroxyalkanoate synthesis regulator phasin